MKAQNLETNPLRAHFKAPSNIAFVKYWGKHGRQLPKNPSISMTLNQCYTETKIELVKKQNGTLVKSFLFEGCEQNQFKLRVEKYLSSIDDIVPWINDYSFIISSENSFPHSTGIASSASAFAALASCIEKIDSILQSRVFDHQRTSFLARLGSGSACRSIYSDYTIWGESYLEKTSNDFAIPFTKYHKEFKNLNDTVLIIDEKEKTVTSSVGHSLMHGHIFQQLRYEQAKDNLKVIIKAMETGDWESFGTALETEALTLHALMMTSSPSYILLSPNSLLAIQKIRKFRDETKLPVYFTIDAGPNIHILYPDSVKKQVGDFVKNELLKLAQNIIYDQIGKGIKDLDE